MSGFTCWHTSEFEDCILKIDFWIRIGEVDVPLQFTTDWGATKGKKLGWCKKRGILILYVPPEELKKADPKNQEFSSEALGGLLKRLMDQLMILAQKHISKGKSLLTPQETATREFDWILERGLTSVPEMLEVA